jgi:hypothetical protein
MRYSLLSAPYAEAVQLVCDFCMQFVSRAGMWACNICSTGVRRRTPPRRVIMLPTLTYIHDVHDLCRVRMPCCTEVIRLTLDCFFRLSLPDPRKRCCCRFPHFFESRLRSLVGNNATRRGRRQNLLYGHFHFSLFTSILKFTRDWQVKPHALSP